MAVSAVTGGVVARTSQAVLKHLSAAAAISSASAVKPDVSAAQRAGSSAQPDLNVRSDLRSFGLGNNLDVIA